LKLLRKSQIEGFFLNLLLIDQANLVEKKESYKQKNKSVKNYKVINNKNQ